MGAVCSQEGPIVSCSVSWALWLVHYTESNLNYPLITTCLEVGKSEETVELEIKPRLFWLCFFFFFFFPLWLGPVGKKSFEKGDCKQIG